MHQNTVAGAKHSCYGAFDRNCEANEPPKATDSLALGAVVVIAHMYICSRNLLPTDYKFFVSYVHGVAVGRPIGPSAETATSDEGKSEVDDGRTGGGFGI